MSNEHNMLVEKISVLQSLLVVMLARSDGPVIMSKDEIEATYDKSFKYEMAGDNLIIELL